MSIKITTNNVPRPVIYGNELNAKERAEFDYLDWPAIDAGEDSATFFRYRGQLYDLGQFQLSSHAIKALGFDGTLPESYFSGVVVAYFDKDGYLLDGGDSVIVGTWTA